MSALRHLGAILALPFMVVVVVPALILSFAQEVDARWALSLPLYLASCGAGLLLLLAGLWLVVKTVRLFATVGKGTLAPWDPPPKLVVEGPYRYVRNPMITGVLAILIGESALTGNLAIARFALFFFILNYIYFILLEEPGLMRRFGEDYKIYRQHVPRWLPRLTPWEGADASS